MSRKTTTKAQEKQETPFCTIPEAARRSGLSEFFIRRGCRNGQIPCIKAGEKYLIDFAGLVEVMTRRAREAATVK